jgi:hypothetical protein
MDLEAAESLDRAAVWRLVEEPPVETNGEIQVPIRAKSGSRFFRLREGPSTLPQPAAYENESDFIINRTPAGIVYLRRGRDGLILGGDSEAGIVLNMALASLGSKGGRIFMKPGLYDVRRPVVVRRPNVSLHGVEGTVLQAPTGPVFELLPGAANVSFHRLQVRNANGSAIQAAAGNGIQIEECMFTDVIGPAIRMDGPGTVQDVRIRSCRFLRTGQGGDAIALDGVRHVVLQNNVIEESIHGGMNLVHCLEIVCVNNVCRDNGADGLFITGSGRIGIRGNHLVGNGGHGLRIEHLPPMGQQDQTAGEQVLVTGNVAVDNGTVVWGDAYDARAGSGISVSSRDCVIMDNLSKDNGGNGVELGFGGPCGRSVVQGNVVADNNRRHLEGPAFGSGISVADPLPGETPNRFLLICGNLVYRQSEESYQLHAIYADSGNQALVVEGNRVTGLAGVEIIAPASSEPHVVRENLGYRTAAAGYAWWSDVSGAGSELGYVSINLIEFLNSVSLAQPFDLSRVHVTPSSDGLGGYLNSWVQQPSSTTLRLNWASDRAQTDLDWLWRYDDH